MSAVSGAVQGWNGYGAPGAWGPESNGVLTPDVQALYAFRWALYTGDAFATAFKPARSRLHPRVYANTRLVYKQATALIDFYANTVYEGSLSTDGKPLPDGTRGAIPIDPQTGSEPANAALLTGIAEFWAAWNWQQQMTLRPLYGAALGDCPTELVDDVARGAVYPATLWPGYVTAIELDYVGNVKSYRLDYPVNELNDDGVVTDSYRFGKQVDKETFRYFRDDKPWDDPRPDGHGAAVQDNPYGFVPMVWDRHQIGWGERGIAATDSTRAALMELNSLFSHAIDFQRKAFAAPIVVKGQIAKPGQTNITLRPRPQTQDDAVALAESLDFLQGSENADLLQATFDVGQTLAAIDRIKAGILEENPEASFYHELRQMTQVTGPGAERLLGDAVARCRRARAGYDAQTVKLFQMALAMAGFRYRQGVGGWAQRTKRRDAWAPFDLDSYANGQLDMSIADRPVVLPTEAERIAVIAQREALTTKYGMEQAGMPEDAITAQLEANTVAQY